MKWPHTTTTIIAMLMVTSWLPCALRSNVVANEVIDFEDWQLEPESAWVGPVSPEAGYERPGFFGGTERVGNVSSGGAQFVNRYNLLFGNWSGFAVSNQTDVTTPGAANQTSAFTLASAGTRDGNYAVAYGYVDDLDPRQPEQLSELPFLQLPETGHVSSLLVSNTTYAALSMLNGDRFSKKFGGESGDDPDFFRLRVYGVDQHGVLLENVAETFLADYRFADNSQDFLVDDWVPLDLEPLADAARLYFSLDSSDANASGMVTPAYFAIDDILMTSAVLGDFNADGVVDVQDADRLCAVISSQIADLEFDLNDDQEISMADMEVFLGIAQASWGDSNLDGSVAFDDFLLLSGSFGQPGTWSDGDSNCDGRVEFSDFLLLSANFGQSSPASQSSPATATIPEPAGRLGLWLMFCFGGLRRIARGRRTVRPCRRALLLT